MWRSRLLLSLVEQVSGSSKMSWGGRWWRCPLCICVFKHVKCVFSVSEYLHFSVLFFCIIQCVCVCVYEHVMACVFVAKARRVFLVFRAVLMRPQKGRGDGGRRGRHARLLDSLASRRGHSPPRFQWWTDGPCSAWLQKKTANVDRWRGARVERRLFQTEAHFLYNKRHAGNMIICMHTPTHTQR